MAGVRAALIVLVFCLSSFSGLSALPARGQDPGPDPLPWREKVATELAILRDDTPYERGKALRRLRAYLRGLELAPDADVAALVAAGSSLADDEDPARRRLRVTEVLGQWIRSEEPDAALELTRRALLGRLDGLVRLYEEALTEATDWVFRGGSVDAVLDGTWGMFERQQTVLHGAAYVSHKLARKMLELFEDELSQEQQLELWTASENGARLAGIETRTATALFGRAALAKDLGRIAEAADLLEDYLRRFPAGNDAFFAAIHLAEIARQRDRFGECLARLDALEALEALKAQGGELDTWRRLSIAELRGQALLDQGLTDLAGRVIRPAYREACEWFAGLDEAGRDPALVKARINARMANLALALGNWEAAETEIAAILEDTLTYALWPRMRTQMEIALGEVRANLERADPAREPRARATIEAALATSDVRTRDRIYAELGLAKIALRRGELERAEGQLAIVGERLAAWGTEHGTDEVLTETLEWVSWRARLALARGDGREVLVPLLADAETAMEGLLRGWSAAPPRPAGVGFMHYDHRRVLAGELTRLCLAALGPTAGAERALEWLVRIQAQGTLFQRSGLEMPDLAECRALLRAEGHGVLLYLPTDEGSHLFALDREDLTYFPLRPRYEIEAARRDYLALLRAPRARWAGSLDRERELARALSGFLLPPEVQAAIRHWSRISVMGVDTLGVVPFACLPAFDAEHLGVARALDQMPSFALGKSIARGIATREAPTRELLLVAGAVPGGRYADLEHLAFTPESRARLVSPYAPGAALVFSGPRATWREVDRSGLGQVRTFQALVHGVFDFGRERPAGLALSAIDDDAGVLWCSDVERFDAPRFVLLASCRSGRERTRRGDAIAGGMGGAWIAAGAQAVLVSHSDLGFLDALDFSEALHPHLARHGADPAEAVRAARAEQFAVLGAEAVFRLGLIDVVGLGHASLYDSGEAPAAADAAGTNERGARGGFARELLAGMALGLVLGLALGIGVARRKDAPSTKAPAGRT